MGYVTITMPFSGTFCRRRLGLAAIKLCAKFEISALTHHEDMKDDKKAEIWVVGG